MILRYRLSSPENVNFLRDIDLPHSMTLLELNDFLISILNYDPCMTSFFALDSDMKRQREYTCVDMGIPGGPVAMDNVTLAHLLIEDVSALDFVFDTLSGRSYTLEFLGETEPLEGAEYPRVMFENADTPDQFDPDLVDGESDSIFGTMMEGMSDEEFETEAEDEW